MSRRGSTAEWRKAMTNAEDVLFAKPLGVFPQPEEYYQIPQPVGLQAGAENPPEPVGIPWALTQLADISFSTSAHSHCGHLGRGSLAERVSSSKQLQQALHWYS